MDNERVSKILKLTRKLLFVNAGVWLIFGVLGFSRAMTETGNLRFMLSVLMVANAIVMAALGVLISGGGRWVLWGAILYMVLNVVLSITDQFGWVDALILLLNLIILGLLFVVQQRFRQASQKGANGLSG